MPVVPVPPIKVTVEQAADQPDPTNAAAIRFTVKFSLPVNGFGGEDISFAGTTAGGIPAAAISTHDFRTFTVTVTGLTTSGDVAISIRTTGTWSLRGDASAGLPDRGVFLFGGPAGQPVVGRPPGEGADRTSPAALAWQTRRLAALDVVFGQDT